MNDWFMWFIFLWSVFIFVMVAIGGYFMFRKFLKKMPKEDGKSILDWQDYYIQETLHLWTEDQKVFLNELVEPVPEIFRDVAKEKIAGKIGELALNEGATEITEELLIRGYILATPKRDHKFLRKKLREKNIDEQQYENIFSQSN
ncbi:DUF2621 domain-containing protein [Salisediminibacterium halotolerans]|uniref:DUF2621 domain-containing protein n=1 Tax=Salisediminibacterium halotolerans TaxID=517425 RepID=UPI000EAD460F|nr:DUF2621 domain-containing protein [Salisediminibacterium halotolerans]RLJ74123.1 uncharacterized protein DUF2621 [Actinophytocola xinjiangensis]RPE87784.1 uncharacterized protein DUF2621 [Salisediminibacterium halotolerans]TWG34960.1 uncharacterized protein DUF2621 [Salisediminibacterium halotolerans]GEL07705.1 hypothetical protein SHA02_11210 [Salisediminibacterium halotolerans]